MADFGVISIFHFTVKATNFERSLDFYQKIGFRLLRDNRDIVWPDSTAQNMGLKRAQGRGSLLGIGDGPEHTRLDLIEWLEPRHADRNRELPVDERIPQIIALRVRNVRALYDHVRAQGIDTFIGEPRGPNPLGGMKGAISLRDPDENLIEFLEYEEGVLGSRIAHLPRRERFERPWEAPLPVLQTPNIFDVMGTQRAMRRLRPDPVPDEYVKKLLWAATRAPNGANRQPWRFIAVRDAEAKQELQRLYYASFERNARGAIEKALEVLPPEEAAPIQRMFKSGEWLAQHLHEVPVIILACMLPYDRDDNPMTGGSIFPAVQNLLLAARALGLGGCLTTIVKENQEFAQKLLGIPAHVPIAAQLPIGWPYGKFGAVRRRPLEEVAFWDRWDRKLE